jgi:hypothetical protein
VRLALTFPSVTALKKVDFPTDGLPTHPRMISAITRPSSVCALVLMYWYTQTWSAVRTRGARANPTPTAQRRVSCL